MKQITERCEICGRPWEVTLFWEDKITDLCWECWTIEERKGVKMTKKVKETKVEKKERVDIPITTPVLSLEKAQEIMLKINGGKLKIFKPTKRK